MPMLLLLLLACLLLGATLGQRFKVMILVPAIALTLTVAVGFAHAETFWQIFSAALLATISLQIGYFAGAVTSNLMAAAGVSRKSATSSPAASTSPQRTAN